MSQLIDSPIEFPLLPLTVGIPGGLKVGLIIRIQGSVTHHAKRFQVNFAKGTNVLPPGQSDLAFHFNPRFDNGYVARNTLVNGEWGPEENSNPSHNPFARSKPFEIMVLIEAHQYKVAVDGAHFLEYNHRIPFGEASILQVSGDLEISKVEFLGSQAVPSSGVVGFEGLEASVVKPQEILNPPVPFRQAIPYEMIPGKTISITARPKPYATRFSINLETDRGDRSDVCLHFNPRFGGRGDESKAVVVRNTLENGTWGLEERETPFFPFNHGFNFDLTILCEVLHFLVAVNGQHLISFKHRLPYEMINTLSVGGELDLISVKFQ